MKIDKHNMSHGINQSTGDFSHLLELLNDFRKMSEVSSMNYPILQAIYHEKTISKRDKPWNYISKASITLYHSILHAGQPINADGTTGAVAPELDELLN